MPDVCDGRMAGTLAVLRAMGIIHRFMSADNQVKEYEKASALATVTSTLLIKNIACAIGVTGDYLERLKKLYLAGCKLFCLDTANGANTQVEEAIISIREYEQNYIPPKVSPLYINNRIFLIVGNVATKEGYRYLADLGVDAIRVGIAGGSVCTTRLETGVYVPMISAIEECAEAKRYPHPNPPLIIADGGIKTPSDMCKALAAGADFVMAGGIFAGTKESPGMVIRDRRDDRLYKTYRGAASFSVQHEFHGNEPAYTEGDESFVTYKGSVQNVIERFDAGLRSSMSYMNATDLAEYKSNSEIGIV
jgi:IMP dehydrogenase